MPSATGQLTGLRFVSESSYGVPSGTAYKALRYTDTSLNLKKAIYESNEIRADRMRSDLRHGLRTVAGDVGIELGVGTFDDLIEAALGGTWAAVTTGSTSLSSDAPANRIDRAAGSFITDGFLPGDEVDVTGFATAGTNGRTKVISVTATQMVVAKDITVSDVAAAARTVALTGKRVKAGTLLKTFHFERAFTDAAQFLKFTGVGVDQLKISVKPESIISGSVSLLGKDMAQAGATHAGSVVAAPTNSPFDAFKGLIQENNATIAYIAGLELTISNGLQAKGVIGQTTPQELFTGMCDVKGTVTAFFPDATLLAKFMNETESSIDVRLDDPNAVDFHRIRIPRIKYTGGDLDSPKEGPVTLTLPFTGLVDTAAATSVIYQRSNV